MLLRRLRGTCSFEAPRQLQRAPTNFPLLDLPDETRILLDPGVLMEGTLKGTYSTRPSSTVLDIFTPKRDAESSDDGLMPPNAYH